MPSTSTTLRRTQHRSHRQPGHHRDPVPRLGAGLHAESGRLHERSAVVGQWRPTNGNDLPHFVTTFTELLAAAGYDTAHRSPLWSSVDRPEPGPSDRGPRRGEVCGEGVAGALSYRVEEIGDSEG